MKTKKTGIWPEPGAWVLDMPKGMSTPQPPEPFTTRVSAYEIRDAIAYEGLGFCIHSYILPQKIADDNLRRLWVQANKSLQSVVDYLAELPPENKKSRTVYNKVAHKKPKPIGIGKEL